MWGIILGAILAVIVISPLAASLLIAFGGAKKLRLPEIELNKFKRKRFERVRWIFNEQFPANDCPVMFLRGAVLKDKTTGKNLLQLKFINSGTQIIKSTYAAIDFIDDAGDIIANGTTIQAEYLDVNCANGDTFGQKQLLDLGDIGVLHIVITYSKVVFTDGTVWRAGTDSQASRPIPVILLKNVLPSELQNEVSEETLCKPETLGGGLWRCTCGCLVRTAGGDACPNCQQTFGQAQESASVSVLEKRKQKKIAEQEQKALDKKVAKTESNRYIKQLIFAIISLYIGIPCIFFNIDYAYRLRVISSGGAELLPLICAMLSSISLIATALLVQRARKDGGIKEPQSARKLVKIQGITALAPMCLILILNIISLIHFSLESIFLMPYSILLLLPNYLYCYQLPYIRERLKRSKAKRVKEIIALVVCGIAVVFAIACIVHIPSCMHFYMGGGVSFDSYIVLPCIISVVVAAVLIIYCSRLPIVKNWSAKRKSRKREK